MTFKYVINLTKTINMPHGNKCVDYVYLTNNSNFINDFIKNFKGENVVAKMFRGKHWVQFNIKEHHYDMVRYEQITSISTTHRPLWKDVEMTEMELRDHYRGQYILDL